MFQSAILGNIQNGKSGIVVICSHDSDSDVRHFWNQISSNLAINVDYKDTDQDIQNVNLNDYGAIVVATSIQVKGRLTQSELDILISRKSDISEFVCNGGGLFVSSCHLENPYGYLSQLEEIEIVKETYGDVTATTEGQAVGITSNNLDVGPWHNTFVSFPSYFDVLLTNAANGRVAAIGGVQIGEDAIAKFDVPKNQFCLEENILADPTLSENVGDHFWSVQESNENWDQIGIEISEWFAGSPSIKDLTHFANSKGFFFECEKFYRIKLAVNGLCTQWNEETKLIKIVCASEIDAGEDVFACCENLNVIQIGQSPKPNVNYNWVPSDALNNHNIF